MPSEPDPQIFDKDSTATNTSLRDNKRVDSRNENCSVRNVSKSLLEMFIESL